MYSTFKPDISPRLTHPSHLLHFSKCFFSLFPRPTRGNLSLIFAVCSTAHLAAEEPIKGRLDPLILTGKIERGIADERSIAWEDSRAVALDGSALLHNAAGISIVRNGTQTGIIQMRGLTGDRVNVLLNGMSISPACPNHMDPPMHYASASSKSLLEYSSGVTPVRHGGDSLAGTIQLSRPDPIFAEKGKSQSSGELSTRYLGSHDAYGADIEWELATDTAILEYLGGWSTANDLRYPGGTVRSSGYTMFHQDIYATLLTGNGYLVMDAGQTRTRDAGTPALPMDMIEADSWHAGLQHMAEWSQVKLESRLYVHSIDHVMDNFSLREKPMMPMLAPSTSRDYGFRSTLTMDNITNDTDIFRVGIDWHRNNFDAYQELLSNGKSRDMFADNRRSRLGAFAEWEQPWTDTWTTLLGLRGDYVSSRAGSVHSQFGPPPVAADAAAFNTGDREHSDFLSDAAASVSFTPNDSSRFGVSMGVKNRAPSLLERYLWTPLSASAGMADGRTYLGNTQLDPETAFKLAASASYQTDRWSVLFSPYYNKIHNYIQGTPMGRLDRAGLPVLQFQNVDWVDLYGAELSASYQFTEQIKCEAQINYVRGKNQDSHDNLYRIAPLHGIVDLAWEEGIWGAHVEVDWAAAQNKVSDYNQEQSSPGYVVVHLRGELQINANTRLEVGVKNIFDDEYTQHLSGVNRVAGSDVALGESIPEAGRFFYTSLSWAF